MSKIRLRPILEEICGDPPKIRLRPIGRREPGAAKSREAEKYVLDEIVSIIVAARPAQKDSDQLRGFASVQSVEESILVASCDTILGRYRTILKEGTCSHYAAHGRASNRKDP